MDIFVSVVIPAFNEERNITKLLESLRDQKFSQNYEIIVIDNYSTDKTQIKVKNFIKKYDVKNIRLITTKGKLGKVRNVGIHSAKGRWIAFIDADEIPSENWLSELIKETKNFNIILGPINTQNPEINFITKYFDLLHKDRKKSLEKGIELKTFGTGNLLIKRTIFNRGILFDDNFPTAEDGDLSYRLYKKGYKFGFSKNALISHRIPESFQQLFYFQKKMILGRLLLFLKHKDLFSFIKLFLDIFYFLTPNFLNIYEKNQLISRFQFIMIGLTSFLISLCTILNPFILFKSRKRIVRPK